MKETPSNRRMDGRPVVVCARNAIVFGYANDTEGETIKLKRARNAYYYDCTEGLFELGQTGPGPKSKIGARADVVLRDITCVIECTEAATALWESAKWER